MAEPAERVVALFTGSRDWTDIASIKRDIDTLPAHALVVHGANRKGADAIAHRLSEARGLHVAPIRARWDLHGKGAGRKRNIAMRLVLPTIVYAYPLPQGSGTQMMMRLAREWGIPVVDRSPVGDRLFSA